MKGLLISLEMPGDTPPAVRGDPARIQQVLFNLIGNAIKFTDEGEVTVALVGCRSVGASAIELKFEVADTGIGMDARTIARLFQPFAQADSSTSRRFGGTGLGLSICRRLVEMMEGEIGVESELGVGTRFWFTLRLDRAARPLDPKPIVPPLISNSRHLRILVADDNEVNSMIICAGLEKLGHRVKAVENGRKAVDAVATNDFDLVLMDMQMPVLDGEAATRAIRQLSGRPGRTPIVAVTADAILAHRARYLAAGLDDILIKPIDWGRMHDLLETIAVRPAETI
jgi:CheY-like chemotaxis protein